MCTRPAGGQTVKIIVCHTGDLHDDLAEGVERRANSTPLGRLPFGSANSVFAVCLAHPNAFGTSQTRGTLTEIAFKSEEVRRIQWD